MHKIVVSLSFIPRLHPRFILTKTRIRDSSSFSMQVILLAQVFITQYLISFADLGSISGKIFQVPLVQEQKQMVEPYRLKFSMRRFIAWVLIRVVLDSEPSVRLFDIELGGGRLDSKRIVVLCFLNHRDVSSLMLVPEVMLFGVGGGSNQILAGKWWFYAQPRS
jgi:hypothetical protein